MEGLAKLSLLSNLYCQNSYSLLTPIPIQGRTIIDMLRLKLSFFGAVKFDPRSDKWLRICMFQGAPLPTELQSSDDDYSGLDNTSDSTESENFRDSSV